jgi:hypothetical protein
MDSELSRMHTYGEERERVLPQTQMETQSRIVNGLGKRGGGFGTAQPSPARLAHPAWRSAQSHLQAGPVLAAHPIAKTEERPSGATSGSADHRPSDQPRGGTEAHPMPLFVSTPPSRSRCGCIAKGLSDSPSI